VISVNNARKRSVLFSTVNRARVESGTIPLQAACHAATWIRASSGASAKAARLKVLSIPLWVYSSTSMISSQPL
jgi:hypothetical protein